MDHLRCLGVVVLGIAASGCEGGSMGPPDAMVQATETSRFSPSLCTGGDPGSPTCPRNQLFLDELVSFGGTFEFVMQAVGSGVYLNHIELRAGTDGLYVERPTLRFWDGLQDTFADEVLLDETLNLPPGGSAMLGTAAVPQLFANKVSLQVKAIGPYRP